MDWIKAKYDRLLLGLFGVIALLIGGLLLMKVMGFKSNFPKREDPKLRTDFGTTDAAKALDSTKGRLVEVVKVNVPKFDGKPIGLFVSTPIVKALDGKTYDVTSSTGEPLRPPIANLWLYENNLDLTRTDIAEIDSDGDGFTNAEEFLAEPKTNPRDKSSTPPAYVKLAYKECVKEPLSLIFTVYVSDKELKFRRSEPAATAFNTPVDFKVGDSFPSEKGGEARFKVVKVDASVQGKEVATVDDLLTEKADDYKLTLKEQLDLPTRKARIVSSLGTEEEKVVVVGEEFYFTINPDFKYKVLNITDEEVELNVGDEKTPIKLKIN